MLLPPTSSSLMLEPTFLMFNLPLLKSVICYLALLVYIFIIADNTGIVNRYLPALCPGQTPSSQPPMPPPVPVSIAYYRRTCLRLQAIPFSSASTERKRHDHRHRRTLSTIRPVRVILTLCSCSTSFPYCL